MGSFSYLSQRCGRRKPRKRCCRGVRLAASQGSLPGKTRVIDSSASGRSSSSLRFDLAVQRNRVLLFAMATFVASLFRLLRLVQTPWSTILGIGLTATASALLSWAIVRQGGYRKARGLFNAAWILVDVFFISV